MFINYFVSPFKGVDLGENCTNKGACLDCNADCIGHACKCTEGFVNCNDVCTPSEYIFNLDTYI